MQESVDRAGELRWGAMPEIEAGSAEQAVAVYLVEHPEIFDRRPEAFLALYRAGKRRRHADEPTSR